MFLHLMSHGGLCQRRVEIGGDRDYNDLVVEITAVPEPGAIGMLLGLAALALRRR